MKTLFVAATRQHVGKTTTCIGLCRALQAREPSMRIGFLKPVGQMHLEVVDEEEGGEEPIRVDKDVTVMREFFGLGAHCRYRDMSPVLMPAGYTKAFIDGKISLEEQVDAIETAARNLRRECDVLIVEGTGHTGVGSVVELNNARVAQIVDADGLILVANGGLGSAYDDLALNKVMCREYGIPLRGVLLNKARPKKVPMLREYFSKLLERTDTPLLGVVPDLPFLGKATFRDFEKLFGVSLIAGAESARHWHYGAEDHIMVTTNLRRFMSGYLGNPSEMGTSPLFVTHVSRADIILGYVAHYQKTRLAHDTNFHGGMIACGTTSRHILEPYIEDIIVANDVPFLHVPQTTVKTLRDLHNFVPKFNDHDPKRIEAAAEHYSSHIDIGQIMNAL